MNGNAKLDRPTRITFAVVGHIIAVGIAVLASILSIGALFAYDSCIPKSTNYGCGSTVHILNAVIPVGGNVVGLIGAAICTWVPRARPRLRWLGIGLGLQVVSIAVGVELLPY